MYLPRGLKSLFVSRKFWLAFLAASSGIVLFFQGQIEADQLANLLAMLAGIVIAGIAVEDAAEKFSS